jgi:hypothetical protein
MPVTNWVCEPALAARNAVSSTPTATTPSVRLGRRPAACRSPARRADEDVADTWSSEAEPVLCPGCRLGDPIALAELRMVVGPRLEALGDANGEPLRPNNAPLFGPNEVCEMALG